MWIKHNNMLLNSNDISYIEQKGTKLNAKFKDGEIICIGTFKSVKNAEDIYKSVTSALLFEDENHPGIIIKDTKEVKK